MIWPLMHLEVRPNSDALVYETHMHTPLCRHADGEIEEYAAVAYRRGLKGITVTCHNPLPGNGSRSLRMDLEQFSEYVRMVERARLAWAGRIDVRLGLECDYLPGLEGFLEKQGRSAAFDYLLGSVHPHLADYRAAFWDADPLKRQRAYFENLAKAAETGLFDCLSHPDIVKNESPEEWEIERILPSVLPALDRIAATGVAMELNTSGLDKEVAETNPGPVILGEMARRGIAVVVGSDAHCPEDVGERFEFAYDLLEEAGYREISFFLGRRRQVVGIGEARRSVGKMMNAE